MSDTKLQAVELFLFPLSVINFHAFVSVWQRLDSYSEVVAAENDQFQELQGIVSRYLDGNSSSQAAQM